MVRSLLSALVLVTALVSVSAQAAPKAAPAEPVAPTASSDAVVNARVGILSALLGSANLSLDIGLDDQWTIGPQASYWRLKFNSSAGFSDFDTTSYTFGVRGNWFKNGRFVDGLYLGPNVSYRSIDLKTTSTDGITYTAKQASPVASLIVGYGWFWDNFNMMLGIGYAVALNSNDIVVRDSNGKETRSSRFNSGLDGEFTLGWTF